MNQPMEILKDFPVRKTRSQKQAFRAAVTAYLEHQGYDCREENGRFGVQNLIIGDCRRAEYLVTAHYDTCARLPFPNLAFPCSGTMTVLWQLLLTAGILAPGLLAAGICAGFGHPAMGWALCILILAGLVLLMLVGPANPSCVNDNSSGVITLLEIAAAMPHSARERVCFVLFDLEEAGLLGSAAYAGLHREASARQLVLNLDCVGDGDCIALLPSGAVRRNRKHMQNLSRCCGQFGKKQIFLRRKGFSFYPSDQMQFPLGVGICALRRRKKVLYLSRIHTRNDTILEITNINLLRAAIVSMIAVPQ